MTELLNELELLKEQILSERCALELPGDSQTVQTARKLLLAGLLGRLPTNGHTAAPETGLPVPLSISPVSPVETAPETGEGSGDATPDDCPTGETQEEVRQEPPPVRIGRTGKNGAEAQDFSGRDAARHYIEECLQNTKGVNKCLVGSYLGTDLASEITKFICEAQDAYRERNRQSLADGRPLKQDVETGFGRLLRAVENATDEDEDEPEPGELESLETETGAGTRTETGPDVPSWWTEANPRTCQQCQALILPKRVGAAQNWEGRLGYLRREYCPRECYQKSRVRTDGTKD